MLYVIAWQYIIDSFQRIGLNKLGAGSIVDYKEVKLEKVEVPDLKLPKPVKLARKTLCPICRSQYRNAIESMFFTGISLAEQERQAKAWGVVTTGRQIKKHMQEHYVAESATVIRGFDKEGFPIEEVTTPHKTIGKILGQYDDPTSPHAIAQVIAARAIEDLATGELKAKNITEVMGVFTTINNINKFKFEQDEKAGATLDSIDDAYRQLQYIMTAIRKTIRDPELLTELVNVAWSEGYNMDITDLSQVPLYQLEGYAEPDMDEARNKYLSEENDDIIDVVSDYVEPDMSEVFNK